MKRKLFALFLALVTVLQPVLPAAAEGLEPEAETTAFVTEEAEETTEAPVEATPVPAETTQEPTVSAPEETSAPTESETTTEATETTASTEEATTAATEPTEETTEPTLDLFAENGSVIDSGTCGTNLTWVLTKNGTLTISGAGEMQDYTWYDDQVTTPWYSSRTKILSAVVEDGVTSIGNCAFEDCSSLKSVTIPGSVTSIGEEAFYYCDSLTSVTIPEGVTSIDGYAFEGCSSLQSVTIPDSVMNIGWRAFYSCGSLTSVTIPEGVEAIYFETFAYCDSLTSVTIPGSVTTIGEGAFGGCYNLTSVTIPGNVTSIDNDAFRGCRKLTSVTIPDSVTSIGADAFYYCLGLISVTIPESITSISDGTFAYCSSLTSVEIPGNVTSIGEGAFYGCSSLRSMTIPKGVRSIGGKAFGDCSSLRSVTIPEGVTSIDESTFYGCSSLTSVTIPGSVKSISYNAFDGCGSLSTITVDNGNANYASMDGVLFNKECTTLILYPAGHGAVYQIPDGVTSVGEGAFYGCGSLTSVTIPASVTSIGEDAFSYCGRLSLITVANGNANYASVDGVLFNKECTTLVLYPAGHGSAYQIPEGVTSIGNDAFYSCSSLRSVTIPNSVTSIGNYAFGMCSSLTGVAIPNGVTSIGKGAFAKCSSLTYVAIPVSVVSIADSAFYDCKQLQKVYYSGSKTEWDKIQIGSSNSALSNANLYCNVTEVPGIEIRPVDTATLNSGSKLTLTAWVMPDGKKAKVNWSLASGDEAYATISSSGVLTAKTVSEVQNITVIATPTDSSPEARKTIQILPKITVKQTEKTNLFYRNGSAALSITGGEIEDAQIVNNNDFVLENNDGQYFIRLADPENAPAKLNTKVTLEIRLSGCDTPIKQTLTVATTNAAPKLKLNPTASIVNTTLTDSLTVEAAILGTNDKNLTARSATKGMTASVKNGKLVLTLETAKTITATVYLKGSDWAKEVKLTHKITVTDKTPTVKFTAKGKLDMLNPASEIVYTPKLTNATGTITDVRLEGVDAKLFNAKVVDGLVHLTMKAGCKYATKMTYKITPTVTLLGKKITGPTLSVKVTQSALKLAKIPNQTVSKSNSDSLTVKLAVTSPTTAEIGDVQLNAKTTAAFRNALEAAGGITVDKGTVSFPAETFKTLKPGKYTVILDVTPVNAAIDAKPIQAKFTLTVQK